MNWWKSSLLTNWYNYFLCHLVGQDVRDRFSGGAEAFGRRNASGHLHGDHSRHRSDDVPSSKDVVLLQAMIFNFHLSQQTWILLTTFKNLVPIQLCCVLLFYLEWQVFCPTPLFSNLIQKGAAVVTGMEAFRRGLFYRAVDQAPLGSQVKSDQVAWCQQVVVYLQGKGFNLVLSPKRQLLPVLQLQKAVVMIHSGALSCCLLELARGNEKRNRSMWVTSDRVNGQHNTYVSSVKCPSSTVFYINWTCICVSIISWLGSSTLQNLMKSPPKTLVGSETSMDFLGYNGACFVLGSC